MTNPPHQGPPDQGPSKWTRPANQGPFGLRPSERVPSGDPGQGPPPTADDQPWQADEASAPHAQPRHGYRPPRPTAPAAATERLAMPDVKPAPARRRRGFFRDPLRILLACIIAMSLILAGLIGAELYARHVVNNKVAKAVACELKDQTTVSFAATPLLLWQLATKHFTNISVSTAGNQIGDARGMKIALNVRDVKLESTPDSAGTIGAIDGLMTWTADGIKQSVQNAAPVLGPFVTNSVVTHPADGTIEFKGMLDNIAAKPVVSGNELKLQIVSFNALGFTLPKESAQSALDAFTADLLKNYPLGIRPDNVQVTPTGVQSNFSTRNVTLPTGGQSPCFANL